MNEPENPVGVASSRNLPALSALQRMSSVYTAPSRTFTDILHGYGKWWEPIIIMLVCFAIYFGAVTQKITWQTVGENNMRNLPAFAQKMMDRLPEEQRKAQAEKAPASARIKALCEPGIIVVIDLIAAAVLFGTIKLGFGGKTTFGRVFLVTLYAGLVLWPLRWLLSAIVIYAGYDPELFNINNPAPTNIAAFFQMSNMSMGLYTLLSAIDVLQLWVLIVTSIGLATVAGVKRSSGYAAVFGWWAIMTLVGLGFAFATAAILG
jgi:hypothetical protein